RGGSTHRWSTTDKVTRIAFSRSGRFLASAGSNGDGKLWDLRDGHEHQLLGHGAIVFALEFSPDEHALASAGWDHTLRVWDTTSGEIQRLYRIDGFIHDMTFVLGGRAIATGSEDGILRLWPTPPYVPATRTSRLAETMHALTTAVLRGSPKVLQTE